MTVRANEFFEKVAELSRARQTFAVATVVARRAPVSAHLGDRAIVYGDGRMEGFVGGACSREIVRRHALEVLGARHGRLVSIRPDATEAVTSDPEHAIVPMTCVSEGAIDVYIEPFVQARRLVIVGATPVAEALARLAVTLDYEVVRVVDASETRDVELRSLPGITVTPLESLKDAVQKAGGGSAAVVASQGHYDEEALRTILEGGAPPYLGLVASRKRGATVRELLEKEGVRRFESIRIPAGLDLGARTAPEVALSILAEIVKVDPAERPLTAAPTSSPGPAAMAIDPVCGMSVDIATARHTADVDGAMYYFCCASCRMRFLEDPLPFLSSRG
jgi:xanthine dehydrogenase accessory factor